MHVEDINVGDWIVILSWKPQVVMSPTGEPLWLYRTTSGDPLHILAVDLPFLVVQFYGSPQYRTTVDTRFAVIRKASDEYVSAVYPNGIPDLVRTRI